MFGNVLSIPRPREHSSSKQQRYVISTVRNKIKDACVLLWYRHHNHKNGEVNCVQNYIVRVEYNGEIPIPLIHQKEELIGTHLELQIMNKELSNCMIRTLFWINNGTIYMATPNDTQRNIDNMHDDLIVTRRSFPVQSGKITMSLRKILGEFYVDLNNTCIPIE